MHHTKQINHIITKGLKVLKALKVSKVVQLKVSNVYNLAVLYNVALFLLMYPTTNRGSILQAILKNVGTTPLESNKLMLLFADHP